MESLALAAATALVGAMATQSWDAARSALVGWWRRVHPAMADDVDGELVQVHNELLHAQEHDADGTQTEEQLIVEWQRRIARLLARTGPSTGTELQRVVDDELVPLLSEAGREHVKNIVRIDANVTQSGGEGNTTIVAGGSVNVTQK